MERGQKLVWGRSRDENVLRICKVISRLMFTFRSFILSCPIVLSDSEDQCLTVLGAQADLDLRCPYYAPRHYFARSGEHSPYTRKTCLYNFDPLKPHFYIVKLGFTGVYVNFLISAQKCRLWVLVRTASLRRFYRVPIIYVLSRNMKISELFIWKFSVFWRWNFPYIWIGVFS